MVFLDMDSRTRRLHTSHEAPKHRVSRLIFSGVPWTLCGESETPFPQSINFSTESFASTSTMTRFSQLRLGTAQLMPEILLSLSLSISLSPARSETSRLRFERPLSRVPFILGRLRVVPLVRSRGLPKHRSTGR